MLVFSLNSSFRITGECLPSLGGFPWRLRQEGMLVAWTAADASEDWLWKSTFLVQYHLLEKENVAGYWKRLCCLHSYSCGFSCSWSSLDGQEKQAMLLGSGWPCPWPHCLHLCKVQNEFPYWFLYKLPIARVGSPFLSHGHAVCGLFLADFLQVLAQGVWGAFGPRQSPYEKMSLIDSIFCHSCSLNKANFCLLFSFLSISTSVWWRLWHRFWTRFAFKKKAASQQDNLHSRTTGRAGKSFWEDTLPWHLHSGRTCAKSQTHRGSCSGMDLQAA